MATLHRNVMTTDFHSVHEITKSATEMLSFIVPSGSIVVIRCKAIALNISDILNWTTFLTFFRQHTHKIYRGHSVHVIVV